MPITSKLSLIAAGTAALVAFPTAAAAEGTYFGFGGGVSFPADSNNQGQFDSAVAATANFPAIPADTPLAWNTDFETGFNTSAQLGYAFKNGFRVELEGAFNRNGVARHADLAVGGTVIDGLDVAVLTRGAPAATNPRVGAVLSQDGGRVVNYGVFANVFYDAKLSDTVKPYVGAGIGFQWNEIVFRPSGVNVAQDTDSGLAYQLMAGTSFKLGDRVQVFGQYTFRSMAERTDTPLNLLPATLGVEMTQNLVSAGVRIGF